MKKTVIAIVAALGISFASVAPANAWGYGYGGWGGWGGYGYGGGWGYGGGYGAAMLGAGLAAGIIGGAIASQSYGYGPYGYGYAAPVYAAPAAPRVKKNIIIKNSPGATVIEEDDIFGGW